jgi:hypothetical protein
MFRTALALLFAIAPALVHAQANWEKKREKTGIVVEIRDAPGHDLKESRSSVQFVADLEKVIDVIFDYSRYAEWAPRHVEAREVARPAENVIVSYTISDSPWPVTDRDIVVRNTVTRRADGSVRIDMKAIEGMVPERDDLVRMTLFEGHYLLEPKPGGQVKVTYQALLDPAGSIPGWMVNLAVVDTPYDVLFNLRRQVTGG